MQDGRKTLPEKNPGGVLHTGTAAGVLVALSVITFFILAATFLKSLVFGIILACFLLPLEKFFERKFLQWRGIRAVWFFYDKLTAPFLYLKNRFSGGKILTPEEEAEKQKQRLIFRSCISSAVSFLLALVLLLSLTGSLLIPATVSAGRKIKENPVFRKTLVRMESAVLPTGKQEDGARVQKQDGFSAEWKDFIRNLRETVPEYIRANHKDIANLAFRGGRGLMTWILSIISSLGNFAFQLLLCAFFFFFFLQHLASFMSGNQTGESIGSWCVRSIFGSRWMPEVTDSTRAEAAEIIDWIVGMFVRWIRGYLWIIIIETLLYFTAFSLCSVPYAPVLALVAGLTILLPFLGPIGSFLLTGTVCLVFCKDHVFGTLIGVGISYLFINGILEQLFLYPKLVGNAMELSTLETIIAVLLGGLAAGIPGMIFAVPAAAILKYLIPKIYQVVRRTGD